MPTLFLFLSALCLHGGGVPGDTCSDAIEISEATTYYNTFQNTDSGYSVESECELMGILYRDIWFSYSAIQEEVITVSTCNSLSFDTSIIVYELGENCKTLSYLTCSGDAPSNSACQPYHSVVEFSTSVDSNYVIRVGGWDENSYGSGSLTVSGPQDPPDTCPTDINDDAVTNVTDILEVINQWGPCFECSADFDDNGIVDIVDFLEVIGNWGECPLIGTWQVLPNSPVAPYFHHDDIDVIGDTMWVCNISGEIWRTTDAGESWTRVLNQPGSSFRAITFIDEMNGWVGNLGPGSWVGSTTDTNPLYSTTDGGLTWNVIPLFAINGPIPDGICGMQAVDENTIFATGRYAGGAYFLTSTDGGATWLSQYMGDSFNTFVDLHFDTTERGYITGRNNAGLASLVYTEDGGTTWTTVITNYSSHYWKMGFASDTFGYAVCSGGQDEDKWVQTYDGGQTWTDRTFTSGFHANGIGFLNEQIGWIGGYDAHTLQTWDGGDTWHPFQIDQVYGDLINRFIKVSDTEMYAVGNRVYKYSTEPERSQSKGHVDSFDNSKCTLRATTVDGVTTIAYTVPEDDDVQLTVFIRGGLIYDRPLEEYQKAGTYSFVFKTQKDPPELYVSIVTGRYRQWTKVD